MGIAEVEWDACSHGEADTVGHLAPWSQVVVRQSSSGTVATEVRIADSTLLPGSLAIPPETCP